MRSLRQQTAVLVNAVRAPLVTLDPSDEAAFRAEQWLSGLRTWRTFLILGLLAMVLWWPFDWIMQPPRPGFRQVYAIARGMTVGWSLVTLALLRLVPSFRRLIFAGSCLTSFVSLAAWAWALGAMGPPRELWFVMLTPMVFFSVIWAFPFAVRAGVLALTVGAAAFGYFGLHPEYIHDPFAPLALSDMVFAAAFSLFGGVFIDRLRRQTFALRLSDARHAREMEEFNVRLESRVREQTTELRRLTMHLESVREEERAHISRELHDELGQQLTALGLAVNVTQTRFSQNPAAIATNLDMVEDLVQRTRATTRHIVTDLRPRILDDLGLATAVEWLARRTEERGGLSCVVSLPSSGLPVTDVAAQAAFRILQESMTNVVRHSRAQQAKLELWLDGDALHLRVSDDGVGYSPSAQSSGMGLIGMRERARALEGDAVIESAPGRGTTVLAWLPAAAAQVGRSA